MPDVAISWYDLSAVNAVSLGHRLKMEDRHSIYSKQTRFREIATALKGLAMTRWSGLVAPIETVR